MLAGHVKNAVMIILLIGVVVLGSYLLQLKVEELQTDKEPLEAQNEGLMENYNKLSKRTGCCFRNLHPLTSLM